MFLEDIYIRLLSLFLSRVARNIHNFKFRLRPAILTLTVTHRHAAHRHSHRRGPRLRSARADGKPLSRHTQSQYHPKMDGSSAGSPASPCVTSCAAPAPRCRATGATPLVAWRVHAEPICRNSSKGAASAMRGRQ